MTEREIYISWLSLANTPALPAVGRSSSTLSFSLPLRPLPLRNRPATTPCPYWCFSEDRLVSNLGVCAAIKLELRLPELLLGAVPEFDP